jgi:hypothetical protein
LILLLGAALVLSAIWWLWRNRLSQYALMQRQITELKNTSDQSGFSATEQTP